MDHRSSSLAVGVSQAAPAARFVSEEAVKIHPGFGGWSQFNDQRASFEYPKPYLTLEALLRSHVRSIPDNECPWSVVFDRLAEAERKWATGDKGARAIFAKTWVKIGENKEIIDPWLNLIPDSYGLAVVKTGVALLLQLAGKHAERRQRIADAFKDIRTAIVDGNYKRRSFHTNPEVSLCARDLYVAIVEAIESLLRSLSVREPDIASGSHGTRQHGTFPFVSHFTRQKQSEYPETALEKIKDRTRALQQTIDQCRDGKIESIEFLSRSTHREMGVMRWDQKQTEINTRQIGTDVQIVKTGIDGITSGIGDISKITQHTNIVARNMSVEVEEMKAGLKADGRRYNKEIIDFLQREDEKLQQFINTQSDLINDTLKAKNHLLELLLEDRKKKEIQITTLQQRLRATEAPRPRPRARSSTAVVSVTQLFALLAQPTSQRAQNYSYEVAFRLSNNDLETILSTGNTFDPQAQGQAQSILGHLRFTEWMSHDHPDLLLVDANLGSSALDNISPMSLFCATFILAMAKVQKEEILAHFFCGLHNTTASHKDPWAGPNGLIRSLVFQIISSLYRRKLLNIDFVHSRGYLKDLEEHDLATLCETLHRLVGQCSPEMTIYCVIDGIGCFDKDVHRSFQQVQVIIDALQDIVQDDMLRCRFKVLMANPDQSTRRLRQLLDSTQHIILNPRHLSPHMISDRSVREGISRSRTPSHSHFPLPSSSEDWGEDDDNAGLVARYRVL
ncbi:hypothetical protein RU639_006101 [Aspergillus parasiticus]